MSAFRPLPLGQRIPASMHAVSCSLPTMRDVRGYEEKDPAVMQHLTSGYPRFVVHPFLAGLAGHLVEKHGRTGHRLWLTSSSRMAGELLAHLGPAPAASFEDDGVHGVSHDDAIPGLAARAKTFLQNVGGFLSSRAAEDELVRRGLLPFVQPEKLFAGDADAEVRRRLGPSFAPAAPSSLLLASCGMNAIYATFQAAAELQAARGRTIWVQLGWLYLDTIAILKKFTATPDDYVYVRDVFDRAGLERLFAEKGERIAGLVSEVPTNPLIQTPDVPALAALARRHGALVVIDPSISCAANLDVLPHSDVVVSSLTKYTASEGDLTAGVVAVNPAGPEAAFLQREIARRLEPFYTRDLARLAAQIGETDAVLARIHATVPRVVAFLERHPAVKEVFWALHPASRDHYRRVARAPDAVGSMVSFSLRGPLPAFYDRLRLPKGPSFGMKTTLICPFMYLAHYDLVTTPAGRAELVQNGIDPELLRLSVGTEPPEDIIAALAEALG
ncbi:MAG TPA: PLP-dependent transferase [Opitutaceae bacterium]|nr:PLP-dependent transferase [Opitutaceae bacterium]